MLMAFAGPLYSQLRAYDSVALASIDLEALHCGEQADVPHAAGQPDWVVHLDKCGYCDLLASNPAASESSHGIPRLRASSISPLPWPEQGLSRQPQYRPLARGPPVSHV